MGRLHTILEKIKNEIDNEASTQQIMHSARMLLLELESIQKTEAVLQSTQSSIVVNTIVPQVSLQQKEEIEQELADSDKDVVNDFKYEEKEPLDVNESPSDLIEATKKLPSYDELEKEFSVLQVNEEEIENELSQLSNHNEPSKPSQQAKNEILLFDPIDDIPTLMHQSKQLDFSTTEINEKIKTEEKPSINELLKTERNEVSSSLSNEPIKDLKKGIGLNDSYLFINELFRGDETMYTRSIKTINGFSNFAEAQFWIERELKLKLGWVNSDAVVKNFDQLVKRRFSLT